MAFPNSLIFFVFSLPLPFLVYFSGGVNYYWDYCTAKDFSKHEFDFIIVGSGSAGGPLANRLSKHNKVLLLEAGGDPLYFNHIPGLALDLLHRPQVDWMHKTVPQKHGCFAMDDNVSLWPRGKLLGGTSNLNYMLYVRCHPRDFDNWANMTGDEGWKYENLLPFYKKSILGYRGEFGENKKHYSESPYGFLHISKKDWRPLYDNFIGAGKELGFDHIDLNGPQQSGFGPLEVTQKNGVRGSTFKAFLQPILSRKNLHVSRYSVVEKIQLDKNNNAIGVWYTQHGVKKFARANKEIIVSAGAVDSPKILMLSGIGPKKHLKSVGIKPKVDLPVGQNLKDHVASMIYHFTIDQPLSFIPERDFGFDVITDYFLYGKGPLTSPTACTAHAFFSSSRVKKEEKVDWPDVQLYAFSIGTYQTIDKDFTRAFGVKKEILEKLFSPMKGRDSFVLMPTLVRPKSIGEITLKDKNPSSPPLIDPHYLEDKRDVDALVEGAQLAVELSKTKSFQKIGAKFENIPLPGCEKHKMGSKEYFECYVRHFTMTLYHPVGTCKMGKPTDPTAVVDSKLRVLKVKGLRVADASIMPEIVNGNTNAPSIMIGEKAADLIRDHWAQQLLVTPLAHVFVPEKNKCFYSNNKMV